MDYLQYFNHKIEGEHSPRLGFTLAEVLITLGIIGIVAAISLPTILSNINDKILNKQVTVFKHKFTEATSKMNALKQMISYENTDKFINEFSSHYSIIQKCKNNELEKCWPARIINIPDKNGILQEINVSDIKTGNNLRAFALGTKEIETSGIISADGVAMILVYSPVCQMNETLTGASTTSCISGIYDVNGAKGPNRIGLDIRTINSLYGSVNLGSSYSAIPRGNCHTVRSQLNAEHVPCPHDVDNSFLGAMKACNDLKLHLPTRETLATAAGTTFGITDLGANENINCGVYNYGWGQPVGRLADIDSTSVAFSGSYWTDTPFVFRNTVGKFSVTMSCNAGCSNAWAQSAICVAD